MRDDLPEIIHMGREKDLHFSVKYQWDPACQGGGVCRKAEKAGLNTVFLQFDGVTDQVYETLRGQAMMELKKRRS